MCRFSRTPTYIYESIRFPILIFRCTPSLSFHCTQRIKKSGPGCDDDGQNGDVPLWLCCRLSQPTMPPCHATTAPKFTWTPVPYATTPTPNTVTNDPTPTPPSWQLHSRPRQLTHGLPHSSGYTIPTYHPLPSGPTSGPHISSTRPRCSTPSNP